MVDTVPVARFTDWDALSEQHAGLLADAARATFFRSVPWFRALGATCLDRDDALRLYVAGEPATLVLPLHGAARRHPLQSRSLASLANFYSCDFAPLTHGGAPRARDVVAIATTLRAERPAIDRVELTSLPCPSDAFSALRHGFADAGWRVQPFFHFATWYESTAGVSADEYLAARPAMLRHTLSRKTRALARRDDVRLVLIGADRTPTLTDAIAAYEQVYRASWKGAEPYPGFAAAFIRAAAETGCLRLGFVMVDGVPAAAQIWIVWQGRATLCKLAHDERFGALSVGTVLTGRMMRHVLEVDRVDEVDFGRGDDPYKQLWMSQRREHWGLLAFNPTTPHGLLGAARHLGGRRIAEALRLRRQRPTPAIARAGSS